MTEKEVTQILEKSKSGTVIVTCSIRGCVHAFQDAHYGGKRLHNLCKSESGRRYARCTVCGNKREL